MAEREPVSLYHEVTARGYEACVIATYCINFPFYERVVLRRLQSSGCRHHILLADARQIARDMQDPNVRPQEYGSDYTLIPVRSDGAFHPKFILLLGRKKARLIIGSHNVTIGGFGVNREVTTSIELEPSGRAAATARKIWSFVYAWTAGLPGRLRDVLTATERVAPWLVGHEANDQEPQVLCTVPSGPSLLAQLKPLIKGVRRVAIISPYFDADLGFVTHLAEQSAIKDCIVAVHPEFSKVPADVAQGLGAPFRFVDLSELGAEWAESKLHAKLYRFELADGSTVVLSGSANASRAAWLSRPRPNAELVIVHENGDRIWRELGLAQLSKLPTVSDKQWESIRAKAAARALEPPDSNTDVYLATAVSDGFRTDKRFVERVTRPVQVYAESGLVGSVDKTMPAESEVICVFRDDAARERATRLEAAAGRGRTRVALVHHVEDLLDKAAGRIRQAFRQALVGLQGDADQLLELIQIVEKAIFDEPITLEPQERKAPKSARAKEVTTASTLEPTTLMVHAKDTIHGRRRRLSPSTDLAAIIDALIYRLGRGLKSDTDGVNSVRQSEETLRESDDETREIDGKALAKHCRSKVNRLFRRMVAQLERAENGETDATSAVIQLAAVLGVVRHLRAAQSTFEWLPKHEELIDRDSQVDFFRNVTRLLHASGSRLSAKALDEHDGKEFAELSMVRALLSWLACDCDIDARTALDSATQNPELTKQQLIDVAHFLPVISDCAADGAARDLLTRAAGGNDIGEAATFHLRWAGRLTRATLSATRRPSPVNLGDVVLPIKVKDARPAIVVELFSDKAGLLDLDTGKTRQYRFGFLASLQHLPRMDQEAIAGRGMR